MKILLVIAIVLGTGCQAERGSYGVKLEVSVPTGSVKADTSGLWDSKTNAITISPSH
jgi:hypothetical protein